MGNGRFSSSDFTTYAASAGHSFKTRDELFNKRDIDPDLDPKKITVRESRDSVDNPESTAIIIAQDVTGSMGIIPDAMTRVGVPTLLTGIYDKRPVTDPHVMCMAVGDVEYDTAPLQVTQFEADIRISAQLEKFFLEGGGGGNDYESYALAWYFAAYHTKTDCWEKRGKRGYLFTVGDEEPTKTLTKEKIGKFLSVAPQSDINMDTLLHEVSKRWEVFHVIVEEGSHAKAYPDRVRRAWINILGQRVLPLADHTKLAEVITAAIEVSEGRDKEMVAKSYGGASGVISHAIGGLLPAHT